MKKVVLTKGLPASGKTTYAKELLAKELGRWKRINKDDLRAMLDNGYWSKQNEKFILEARDFLLTVALGEGYNVIIDDTNLAPKHEAHISQLIEQFNATETKEKAVLEIKDFTDVSLEECIKRDQKRANYVGEKVIKQMYKQFLMPKPPVIEYKKGHPDAVICDVDGTLALFGNANPYDRDFMQDKCNMPIYEILNRYSDESRTVILVSGRSDKYREVTEKWLKLHGIFYGYLFMRKEGDMRRDVIIKQEIYEREIKERYNVIVVLDDRLQVCEMWYQLGLPLLKFGDPNSDF